MFTHSFSGKKISDHLKSKYKGRKLISAIGKLSVVMNFKQSQVLNFVLFSDKILSPYFRIPRKLKIYLEVERELLKLTEEKLDEYTTAAEDYQRMLLFPAIERTAGNLLSNVISDFEFQESLQKKIREYTSSYYKVVDKYKLPTIRVVPFIIRIIT